MVTPEMTGGEDFRIAHGAEFNLSESKYVF